MNGVKTMTENQQEYFLQRSGLNPLKFTGTLIAYSSGKAIETEDNPILRWHDIDLYRTASGKYVLHIQYFSDWEGEMNHSYVAEFDRKDAARIIRKYDPVAYVEGFPPLDKYAMRQQNLLNWIRRRYEEQINAMLADLGDELAENIE